MKKILYKGMEFKSQLAAKWACFFDSINLDYQYQLIGHIPEFYFPDSGYYGAVANTYDKYHSFSNARQRELLYLTTGNRECKNGIVLFDRMPPIKYINADCQFIGFPLIYQKCNLGSKEEEAWSVYEIVMLKHADSGKLTFSKISKIWCDGTTFYMNDDECRLPGDIIKNYVYFARIICDRKKKIKVKYYYYYRHGNTIEFKRHPSEIGESWNDRLTSEEIDNVINAFKTVKCMYF